VAAANFAANRQRNKMEKAKRKAEFDRRLKEAQDEVPEKPTTPSPTKHKTGTPSRTSSVQQQQSTPVTPKSVSSFISPACSVNLNNSLAVMATPQSNITNMSISSHQAGISRYFQSVDASNAANNLIGNVDFQNGLAAIRDEPNSNETAKLLAAVALAAMDTSNQAVKVVSNILQILVNYYIKNHEYQNHLIRALEFGFDFSLILLCKIPFFSK
jgi:hypothetical protein